MDRKLHIGIIGCGGIANGKHMPSLKKIDTVEKAMLVLNDQGEADEF